MAEVRHVAELGEDQGVAVEELSREAVLALLNSAARQRLNMSGEEFLRTWDEGRLKHDDLAVLEIAALIPGVRP